MLRILTKWASYLEGILEKPESFVHNRNYPFKNIKGDIVLLSGIESKNKLIEQIKEQNKEVKRKFKELKRKSYEFIG